MNSTHFFVAAVLLFLTFTFTSVSSFPIPLLNEKNNTNGNNTNPPQGPWQPFKQFAGCQYGQSREGLAKVKLWFERFGYIPPPSANFSDDFDDALQNAIKTYQKNFNLNITGSLDNQTITQIVRPRCGVADIVNGSSTMNSGEAASSTTDQKLHNVAHFAFFPGRPQWPSSMTELRYAFYPASVQVFNSQVLRTIFNRAFSRWAEVIPLTFTETDDFQQADLRIGFFSGDHGDGEPFDGVLGTLAHAFSPTDGRFHLDADEEWVGEGDVERSSLPAAIDLESVAVHEIGHLLGLGHSSVEEAIMFPTISSGTRKVDLQSDDVQGIQTLYGSNPNYNGTTNTSPSSQGESNDGGEMGPVLRWSAGLVIGITGLLLL